MAITKQQFQRYESDEDGHWIYLKSGWQDAENPLCHTIVETTKSAAFRHDAKPCECRECANQ